MPIIDYPIAVVMVIVVRSPLVMNMHVLMIVGVLVRGAIAVLMLVRMGVRVSVAMAMAMLMLVMSALLDARLARAATAY